MHVLIAFFKVLNFLYFIMQFQNKTGKKIFEILIPEPTARSAVPGVSPGRGLLIPL